MRGSLLERSLPLPLTSSSGQGRARAYRVNALRIMPIMHVRAGVRALWAQKRIMRVSAIHIASMRVNAVKAERQVRPAAGVLPGNAG